MKVLILAILSIQLLFLNSQVISRNGKIEEMIQKVEDAQIMFDTLIEESQKKVFTDYDACISQMQELNCSQFDIWQHERAKHSKNITNMQQKLKNHQQTIYKIMELNNQESQKKYLTIDRLLPKMIKIKNDIEFLDGILFIIDDTYINIDTTEHSILEMFDPHFTHPVESKLIQLMQQQSHHMQADPGAKPGQQDYLPYHPEEPIPQPPQKFNQGPPLIDEEIFDGQPPSYIKPEEPPKEVLTEDIIPEGVNIPEHDAKEKSQDAMQVIMQKYKQQKEEEKRQKEFENLGIDELEGDFKDSIKMLGQQMKDKVMQLRQTLSNEQDTLAQSVADLEHSMIDLHHRHAKQIVQLYIEMKHLQKMIFEKDDIVLRLDGSIQDCSKKEEKTQTCNDIMEKTKQYTEQLKAQKEFNNALLKELDKLQSNYDDKNVETPVIEVTPVPDPKQVQKEAKKQVELEKARLEIEQIQAAEQEVAQQEEKTEIVTLDKNLIQKKTGGKKKVEQKTLDDSAEIIDQMDEKDFIPQSSALIAAQLKKGQKFKEKELKRKETIRKKKK